VYLIGVRPSPTVADPSKWSEAFLSFLSACLAKDPLQRATARELLKMPFVSRFDPKQNEDIITELLVDHQRRKSEKHLHKVIYYFLFLKKYSQLWIVCLGCARREEADPDANTSGPVEFL